MLKLKNLLILISTILSIYFLGLVPQHLGAEEIFQQGDHCLAYKAKETILLFVDSDVIGKTCEISARLESEGGNTRYVVSFPIRSLYSGIDMRDEDVNKILSVESHPYIRFVSDFVTGEQVVEALIQGTTTISGILEVGGRPYKVIFPLKLTENSGVWLVTGKLVTSLSKFGLELPAVLGGVVGKVLDHLELLVHLRLDRVHGVAEFQKDSMSQ